MIWLSVFEGQRLIRVALAATGQTTTANYINGPRTSYIYPNGPYVTQMGPKHLFLLLLVITLAIATLVLYTLYCYYVAIAVVITTLPWLRCCRCVAVAALLSLRCCRCVTTLLLPAFLSLFNTSVDVAVYKNRSDSDAATAMQQQRYSDSNAAIAT